MRWCDDELIGGQASCTGSSHLRAELRALQLLILGLHRLTQLRERREQHQEGQEHPAQHQQRQRPLSQLLSQELKQVVPHVTQGHGAEPRPQQGLLEGVEERVNNPEGTTHQQRQYVAGSIQGYLEVC